MIKKVYTEVEVDVDVDLEDFNDDELISELEWRDYKVVKLVKGQANPLQDVIDWYARGNTKEALYQLEQICPELYGISEKVK